MEICFNSVLVLHSKIGRSFVFRCVFLFLPIGDIANSGVTKKTSKTVGRFNKGFNKLSLISCSEKLKRFYVSKEIVGKFA